MTATMTATDSILPALVKIVRPFAHKGSRGPVALRDALVRHDGGSTRVVATDLEIACLAIACEPRREPAAYLVDAASGVPVGDAHDPLDFPAVDRLDGATVAEFTMSYRDLRRVADHVAVATDNETSRYALGGVLVEVAGAEATFVGTNARRLHALTVPVAVEAGAVSPNTIIPGRLFPAAAKAVKAAAALAGIKSRNLDGETITVTIAAKGCRLAWGVETVAVECFAKLIEGRFPQWRECVPADAGTACPVEAAATVKACREAVLRTKAAEGAARAAWVADRIARGWKSTKARDYVHQRGARFSADGMACLGCDYRAAIATEVETILDPAYLGQAVEAAAEVGGSGSVALEIVDRLSAVTIRAGGFLAIVMPMAAD